MIRKILIITLTLVVVADVILTLWGQPIDYWYYGGNPNEENLVGAYLLSHHWVFFIFFILAWLSFLMFMVKWLIRPLDIIFGVGITVGHISAVQSWIEKLFQLSPLIRPMAPSLITATIFISIVLLLNVIFKVNRKNKRRKS